MKSRQGRTSQSSKNVGIETAGSSGQIAQTELELDEIEDPAEVEVELVAPHQHPGQDPGQESDIGELDLSDSSVSVDGLLFNQEKQARSESTFDAGEPSASGSTEVVRYDPLQSYIAEVRRFPLLSKEEEHEIALRWYRHGDREAAYRLVMANLRLVTVIARDYQRNIQNILDLIQEGNIGLLEAVKQFDPFRGIRFPSYAAYWIRAYMLRYLINNMRLVKLGTTQAQRKLFFNLQKEKEKLEAEGFIPEAKLLAERLRVKESEVIEMEQRLGLPDVSVDAPLGKTDDAQDLHSILPDRTPNTEEKVANSEFKVLLGRAVDDFKTECDDKEKAILERRLFTEDPVTLQDIADEFSLSRERIRQIESRLKDRLKEFLGERLGLDENGQISFD
jgi:RNA polymerase sigma-32 factor